MINYTNTAIVNFSNDQERYKLGQKRQMQSLSAIGYKGSYYSYSSFTDIGSPSHKEIPYAFKPYAIKKVRDMGYKRVIWMDAPVYAVKPIDHFLTDVHNRGALFFDNIGYSLGDYTSDKCLDLMGINRNDSFSIPMIMACLMAFDFTNQKTCAIFDEYLQRADFDHYGGAWDNHDLSVSEDRRVKGHRHDQSVMSAILHNNGIKPLTPHKTWFAYYGNAGHLPHAQTVCLLSQGF